MLCHVEHGFTSAEMYAPYNTKNTNGYYEVPDNLERNGLNNAVETLTLGEINNHVLSITDNLPGFTGTQPGSTNIPFKD